MSLNWGQNPEIKRENSRRRISQKGQGRNDGERNRLPRKVQNATKLLRWRNSKVNKKIIVTEEQNKTKEAESGTIKDQVGEIVPSPRICQLVTFIWVENT